jgi:phosphopantothenoylcysteine decarboxylase/phosphopantothenate--cysteine ligase
VVHHSMLPLVTNIPVTTAAEMRVAVHQACREEKPDLYISAAAISDYAPERQEGKLKSGTPRSLELRPLPKLIDEVMAGYDIPVVAFKLGRNQEESARQLLEKGIRMVVINGPEAMGSSETTATILDSGGKLETAGSKKELAEKIWERILAYHPDMTGYPAGQEAGPDLG